MANDYCTTAEIKEAMPDAFGTSTAADTFLAKLATRASREFDRLTNRHPGAYYVTTASDRYFKGDGSTELWPGEMAAAPDAIAVAETGELSTYTAWTTASDVLCWPYNASDEGLPYLRLDIDTINGSKTMWYSFPKAIKVTAKWGYTTTTPDEVKQAVATMAARMYKRGQQGFADVGAIAELGQLRYVKGQDPAVDELIDHLRRQAI